MGNHKYGSLLIGGDETYQEECAEQEGKEAEDRMLGTSLGIPSILRVVAWIKVIFAYKNQKHIFT